MHVLWLYYGWPAGGTWSNVLAMPACAAVAGVAAFVFRDRLGSWWRRHFGHCEELAELRELADRAHETAAKAHLIMSDLFEHTTGVRHPDAPGRKRGTR